MNLSSENTGLLREVNPRFLARVPAFLAAASAYVASSLVLGKIAGTSTRRHAVLARHLSRMCKISTRVLGIQVELEDPKGWLRSKENFLIVANHMSYTDVLAISRLTPSVFVTSVEVQNSFFLGFLSTLGGSLFVERRNRSNIDGEIAGIAKVLATGVNLVIFPEGTSSDGQQVLPFKRSLLKAAIDAKRNILPVCLEYTHINGKPISRAEVEPLCYYGTKDFFPHLKFILGLRSFRVRVSVLDPILVSEVVDRKDIADRAYNQIVARYNRSTPRLPH